MNYIFFVYEEFADIFFFFLGGGSSQNSTIFRGHFYANLGYFLKVKVQNGEYLGGVLKFKYFVLEIHDISFLSER